MSLYINGTVPLCAKRDAVGCTWELSVGFHRSGSQYDQTCEVAIFSDFTLCKQINIIYFSYRLEPQVLDLRRQEVGEEYCSERDSGIRRLNRKLQLIQFILVMLKLKINPSDIPQPMLNVVCSWEDATRYLIINGGSIVHLVYEVLWIFRLFTFNSNWQWW